MNDLACSLVTIFFAIMAWPCDEREKFQAPEDYGFLGVAAFFLGAVMMLPVTTILGILSLVVAIVWRIAR